VDSSTGGPPVESRSGDLLADCFEYDHDVGVLVGEYMRDGSAQACLVSNRRNGTTFKYFGAWQSAEKAGDPNFASWNQLAVLVESDRGSSSRRRLNRRDGRGILP
jgi:hypothetical protein